jgi:hypothetical protein
MFVSLNVSSEQKVNWLKQWNQSFVLCELQKFPKVGSSEVTFDKWL